MFDRIAVGDFYLLERESDRFEIVQHKNILSGYAQVTDIYRSCGGVLNKITKNWNFNLRNHDKLLAKASQEINDLIKFIPLKSEPLNIYLYALDRQHFQIQCNYRENDFLEMLDKERVSFRMEEDKLVVEYVFYDKIVNKIAHKYINTDLHKVNK